MATLKTTRRRFICSASAIALGSACYGMNTRLNRSNFQTKEELFTKLDELVDKYLTVYGTCSQTTFIALNEAFNLQSENIVKALAPFPGVAFRGETCGAVSGSLCGIALIFEGDEPGNQLSSKPCVKFCSKIDSEYGSTRCREIIAHKTGVTYTIQKPEDYSVVYKDGGMNQCPAVIKGALHIAAEIILEKPGDVV